MITVRVYSDSSGWYVKVSASFLTQMFALGIGGLGTYGPYTKARAVKEAEAFARDARAVGAEVTEIGF